ncbi:MAG: DUF4179 domain-containing protein [Peptoniphilus sp.]|nr:DUF4179 domain-containing protein [Peptoniphilus sp.]MDD7363594.1 DUF4179 domain-containing protein [Bacillota bacterium]MDY6045215.1 DUF4179 domain-containing protein [Peptoniphilus sp.]
MKKMLYDKFNDIDIDYEEIPLDEMEKQKLYNTVKNLKKKKKRKTYARTAKIAAALVIALGVTNVVSGGYVMAKAVETVNQIHVGLSEAMGLSNEANRYSVRLNQPVDINGEKIIVDDIAFDGEDLYAVILSEDKGDEPDVELEQVKVDGKVDRVLGSSGSSYALDSDHSMIADSRKYTLENPLPAHGRAELELEFSKLFHSDQKTSIVIDLDMAKMEAPKRVVAKDVQIDETRGIAVDRFTLSPLAQKMVLTYPESESDYMYRLEGTDSKGRVVNFEVINSDQHAAHLYFSPETSDITADELLHDVDRLDCQLYRQALPDKSGKVDTKEDKVGEEFEIDIK